VEEEMEEGETEAGGREAVEMVVVRVEEGWVPGVRVVARVAAATVAAMEVVMAAVATEAARAVAARGRRSARSR
jgi:hypothetical protein